MIRTFDLKIPLRTSSQSLNQKNFQSRFWSKNSTKTKTVNECEFVTTYALTEFLWLSYDSIRAKIEYFIVRIIHLFIFYRKTHKLSGDV